MKNVRQIGESDQPFRQLQMQVTDTVVLSVIAAASRGL
jgi:hypothetical protein